MSRVQCIWLFCVLSVGLASCKVAKDQQPEGNAARNGAAVISAAVPPGDTPRYFFDPPGASTPRPQRHGWMLLKGKQLKERIDRVAGCGAARPQAKRVPCGYVESRAAPLDAPFDYAYLDVVVAKYRAPLPLPKAPFDVIHDLFPRWYKGGAWIRQALRGAINRYCPVAVKIDDIWIVVDRAVPQHGPYQDAIVYLSPYDYVGADVARCNAEHVADARSG